MPSKHPVFRAIGQDLKTQLHEFDRSLNQTERIRLKTDFIADHFEFDEVGLKQLACHACGLHRFTRTETTGCVWENRPPRLPK